MEAVVEFQGFKDNDNRFVIKELALVSKHFKSQVIFDAPYSKTYLDEKTRRTVKWLAKNFHYMNWNESGLPYDEDFIKSLCQPFKIIYTKGTEKVNCLSEFHPNVKDIDSLISPDTRCFLHQHKDPNANCALRNAEQYFKRVLK